MRPLSGDGAWTCRQRDAAHRDTLPLTSSTSGSHMSFIFADEASIDSHIEQSDPHRRFREPRKPPLDASPILRDDKDHDISHQQTADQASAYSPISRISGFTHSPASFISQNHHELSRPITPIMLGTSVTGSAMSSPSSRRHSLDGSISEHAIDSDEDDHEIHDSTTLSHSGSAPQLVMPSIQMPSRRPFTETGKSMGRLKILLAGDSGTFFGILSSMVNYLLQ
jgi:hypothetical protein